MICPNCKCDIEDDSFYCDQCGAEIMICPKCKSPGKGKICTQDGTKLIPAKEAQTGALPALKQTEPAVHPGSGHTPAAAVTAHPVPEQAAVPGSISFTNKAINARFSPADGDVIGRNSGQYVHIFGNYNQVSGRHAQINNDTKLGWCITDLGSSNGTKYNGQPLTPNVRQPLTDKSFVLIANIEFYIQIEPAPSNASKTVRI